jgi:hypothetical protein
VEAATLALVANSTKEHVVLRVLVDYQQKPGMAELGEPLLKVFLERQAHFVAVTRGLWSSTQTCFK